MNKLVINQLNRSNRLISGTPLTFQSVLHSIYVALRNSKFMSNTCDVNRVQKVHLSEICSV
jgi:methyl coenzyme M reductase subunit C-like uncharacterized protein (methanogenesis marker protein 7)